MRTSFTRTLLCVAALLFAAGSGTLHAQWVTAYYAGWQQGYLPAQSVDYSAVTHICHFALVPNSNGSLDDQSNGVTATNAAAVVSAAHAAGKKVLITVGGWGTESAFLGATASGTRATFVNNLVSLMRARGYDGIDIDWEPLNAGDAANYTALVSDLRTALNAITPRPLLTMATQWTASISATVATQVDQINIMTYDLAGAWPGWVTWHNSATYSGTTKIGSQLISCDDLVNAWSAAGVPLAKLGIGIDFYGYVWSGGAGTPTGGATAPNQTWTTAPSVTSNVAYHDIMDTYYQPGYYRWDANAQASYLSIDNAGSSSDKFISYDDQATIRAKFAYARNKHIGGLIIWELGGGYRANKPAGQRDSLLQAVKQALGGVPADITPPVVSLTAPAGGSTVSGTVTVSANASDNVGVAGVQFQVNGANLGSEVLASPYTTSWNTSTVTNGSYNLSAIARDAAGNKTTATIPVSVSNSAPPVVSTGYTIVSQDDFNRANQRPVAGGKWTNLLNQPGSGTMELVNNAIQPYNANGPGNAGGVAWDSLLTQGSGIRLTVSQKANNNANSSLFLYIRMTSKDLASGNGYRLRYVDNPSGTDALYIERVTNGTTGTGIASLLREVNVGDTLAFVSKNDASNTLAAYVNGAEVLTAVDNTYNPPSWYAWVRAFVLPTIPRYDNFAVMSATASPAPAVPAAPVLASPLSGANGVTVAPTLTWNQSSGATSYRVQLASNSSFTTTVLDRSGLTAISQPVSGLQNSTTYYWHVNAANSAGTGGWSAVSSFTTGPATSPADTTRPIVSITTPLNGATISATSTLSANASDNVRVVGVQFKLDGTNVGNECTTAPYSYAWNSTAVANGVHSISATARDSAGNQSTATISVTVSNTVSTSADLWIYQDALQTPWIDASWTATVTYGSTDRAYAGTTSVKVAQGAWGGLSFHFGSWGGAGINTTAYSAVSFAVYGGASGANITALFENDARSSFPSVALGTVAANTWKVISVPIAALNPNAYAVNRLDIMEVSGGARTYYVDNIRLVGLSVVAGTQGTASHDEAGRPGTYELSQNYPNPFNPSTNLRYVLPEDARVTLEVYNEIGQRVASLVEGVQAAGEHTVVFDATGMASGIYFYRLTARAQGSLQTAPFVQTKRMMYLK